MTPTSGTADTAPRVADRLKGHRLAAPWDVYGERVRKYEVHLSAGRVELIRGPVAVEGYGLRVIRPGDGTIGTGFQASTDLSAAGVQRVVDEAESNARFAKFPARSIELPSTVVPRAEVSIIDPSLWDDPAGSLRRHIAALQDALQAEPDASVTFGSVKAILTETTLANSSGLEASYQHATVMTELGVLAHGGPEGAPAGEYWVTDIARRLETDDLPSKVHAWARYARDARHASPPPTGEIAVLLPPESLDGILPGALGFQFSGMGRLHELAPAKGAAVGPDWLEIADDGTVPWAPKSSPFDDEGVGQRRRELVLGGRTDDLMCDLAHASATGLTPTGNGLRIAGGGPPQWLRFTQSPRPTTSTISIPAGVGGTDEELAEQAGEGVLVQQFGWASPDGSTTAFGGEIRIGYRIHNGKIGEPIRGGTVGGRVVAPDGGRSLLHDLVAAGKTPQLSGGVLVPSLLSRGLTVSGES